MFLRLFTVTLEPADPLQFSLPEFRSALATDLAEYLASEPGNDPSEHRIYRYPALQCKQIRDTLITIGICQGAAFLRQLALGSGSITAGGSTCTIVSQDPAIRTEAFGTAGTLQEYEFLSPWLALNQQYARKFYDLSGKPARDAFMERLLLSHLNTLAKSLDAPPREPVTCTAHLKFRREQIDRRNAIVFQGRFRTNLCIPDYLGIGQAVSRGYGTIRKIDPPLAPDVSGGIV